MSFDSDPVMDGEFFVAAADWADAKGVPVAFARDGAGDWRVYICLKDSNGPFHGVLVQPPRVKRRAEPGSPRMRRETGEEYNSRVQRLLTEAIVQARKDRQGIRSPTPDYIAALIADAKARVAGAGLNA